MNTHVRTDQNQVPARARARAREQFAPEHIGCYGPVCRAMYSHNNIILLSCCTCQSAAALKSTLHPNPMPLSLLSLDFGIVCDGEELELYNVNMEDPSSVRAFVASEAGKVSIPLNL
jgi:hypothetical protein